MAVAATAQPEKDRQGHGAAAVRVACAALAQRGPLVKIYTRTGDGGETGLYRGARTSKTSPRIEAIGAVDELCAWLGLAAAESGASLRTRLEALQGRLFELGADLAASSETCVFLSDPAKAVRELEEEIDAMEASLPPLRHFILPGGAPDAARLHLARAVCRRAERALWALAEIETVPGELPTYLNRLSDWLFVAAREANRQNGAPETEWRREGEKR